MSIFSKGIPNVKKARRYPLVSNQARGLWIFILYYSHIFNELSQNRQQPNPKSPVCPNCWEAFIFNKDDDILEPTKSHYADKGVKIALKSMEAKTQPSEKSTSSKD
jgi:hypothetical protein